MKMQDFEVGTLYRNCDMSQAVAVKLDGMGTYWLCCSDDGIDDVPMRFGANLRGITRDDWEVVEKPWSESELRAEDGGKLWDRVLNILRGNIYADILLGDIHVIDSADDLKDFLIRNRQLDEGCREAVFASIGDREPVEKAGEQANWKQAVRNWLRESHAGILKKLEDECRDPCDEAWEKDTRGNCLFDKSSDRYSLAREWFHRGFIAARESK